jgi:protein-S-isoprenylcysteine O-methyltransferase Ste14
MVRSILGSILFLAVPALVALWIPSRLTAGWRLQPPIFGLPGERALGAALGLAGLLLLLHCVTLFAVQGLGTPSPVMPTRTLVVSGPYRHVRNPMYLAVLAFVVGQGLRFGHAVLLQYAAALWMLFHLFVVVYEEPTLSRQWGASYDRYREHVRRWWPRLTPWR